MALSKISSSAFPANTTLSVQSTLVLGNTNATSGSYGIGFKYNSGEIATIGAHYSSGGPYIGYGIRSSANTSAGGPAYISTTGINISRSVLEVLGSQLRFKTTMANNYSTAVGSEVPQSGFFDTFTVNTSGQMLVPNQPAFSATRNAGDVTYNTEILFEDVSVNTGNCYNPATGRFTAPVTGVYMFSCFGMSANLVNVMWLQIRKNGSVYGNFNPYHENNNAGVSKYLHAGGTFIMQLNANEYASVYTGNNTGITMYGQGNGHNGFCGYLIG